MPQSEGSHGIPCGKPCSCDVVACAITGPQPHRKSVERFQDMLSPMVCGVVQSCVEEFGSEIPLCLGVARSVVQSRDGDCGCSHQVNAEVVCSSYWGKEGVDQELIELELLTRMYFTTISCIIMNCSLIVPLSWSFVPLRDRRFRAWFRSRVAYCICESVSG